MTDQLNVSERARKAAWPLRSFIDDGALDRVGWLGGAYDHTKTIQAIARFEQPLLDRVRELEAGNARLRDCIHRAIQIARDEQNNARKAHREERTNAGKSYRNGRHDAAISIGTLIEGIITTLNRSTTDGK